MSSNLWAPPAKTTLYDWKIPWHVLKPVGNDNPNHTVILSGTDVLLEMLDLGFLTGGAKSDAEALHRL